MTRFVFWRAEIVKNQNASTLFNWRVSIDARKGKRYFWDREAAVGIAFFFFYDNSDTCQNVSWHFQKKKERKWTQKIGEIKGMPLICLWQFQTLYKDEKEINSFCKRFCCINWKRILLGEEGGGGKVYRSLSVACRVLTAFFAGGFN